MTYLAAAFILGALGIMMLFGEYFFAPGGFLLVAAILCFFAAIAIIGIYGSTIELVAASIVGMIGIPTSAYGAIMMWKKVFGVDPSPAAEASISEMPELAELEVLRGRVGRTITPMRPSGMVEFDGRRIDAMSEGLMLDANVWVKCITVKSGKVIVRQVEPEALSNPVTETKFDPISPTPPASDRKKPDLNADDWTIT